jgi:Transposase domain (DUF772)/Transposase DDE domain
VAVRSDAGVGRAIGALFSYVDLEDRVPAWHPLRTIRAIVNQALEALSGDFDWLYGRIGRPGVPPEKLLRALLLQAFYSIRSERQLMERLDFDLLFRWFVGLAMVGDLDGRHRITVGGDKGYDVKDFAVGLRALGATPHIARHDYVTKTGRRRRSSVDRRTTRHPGYLVSQRRRKLIEEAFGWIKTVAGQAKTSFRGLDRVAWSFQLAAVAYNLIRLPKLLETAT